MTRAEWLALLFGVPATILAAAGVAAALMRWQATSTVFWVLKTHPQRWAALAKDVGVFDELFDGASLAQRLELENERLHTMIVEKLEPLASLPIQFAKLDTSVQHFTDQVGRLAKAVEDMPTRVAVLEEQQRRGEHQERTGPGDRRRK